MSRLIKDIVLYMLSAFITFYSPGFIFKGKRVKNKCVVISSEFVNKSDKLKGLKKRQR